jgi:hypothetical protein
MIEVISASTLSDRPALGGHHRCLPLLVAEAAHRLLERVGGAAQPGRQFAGRQAAAMLDAGRAFAR